VFEAIKNNGALEHAGAAFSEDGLAQDLRG